MRIEKNIPIPPSTNTCKQGDVLAQMRIGDSVLVSQKQAISVYSWLRRRGMLAVQRAEYVDGKYVGQRVWRTA